jgi:hypothetical protein
MLKSKELIEKKYKIKSIINLEKTSLLNIKISEIFN